MRAADPGGNRLTITQPTNGSFLSPVLSMQQTTTIGGLNVRYDTFAVPALRRTVKAVLFTADQAASLGDQAPPPGTPAVLFAVAEVTIELGVERLRRAGLKPAIIVLLIARGAWFAPLVWLNQLIDHVEYVGASDNRYALERNIPVFLCDGAKFGSLAKIWPQLKKWD